MSFNRYYQDELLALRELGKEFTERNPALAPFLGTPGRDPDVERLLEGFAFLTGRLRQKLDDELPEITHSLFSLLWPNYLRPVPACSVIQYRPGSNLSGMSAIARGSLVESVPVDGARCRFRTVYDTEIAPLRIADMRVLERNGEAALALRLQSLGPTLDTLPLKRLRFFLTGETAIAHNLYYTLATRLRETRVVLFDAQKKERTTAVLPPSNLRPVGFMDNEGLYPYPANTFPGYRILQEYFCFPEKFLFVELSGLEQGLNRQALKLSPKAGEFEIHFVLHELPEAYASLRPANWRLFCTPVVNLFSLDASPLELDQRRTEYRIVPDPRLPGHYAVYSVDSVAAWGENKRADRRYLPFESFEHDSEKGRTTAYYRLRTRLSHQDEGTESYISFVQNIDGNALPQREIVSLELTCTNRAKPASLGVGDIRVHADNAAGAVDFANIIPVVPSFNPPLEGDLLWRLLSNMSLNYVPLTDARALRALLETYDFRARRDKARARILEKTLRGIVEVTCAEADRIYRGLPVRGLRTRMKLDQRAFVCKGAMYLFGSVLNEFFALYATVNSFHQLTVEEASWKEEYTWPARLGRVTIS
jgi:type VI secretion system protein ImpG